jgi:polyhydroxyalkanoate synthesis regulator phasin
MVNRDAFQKYLEAGIAFTAITRARAEELVADLVQNGEFQGSDARAKVDELIELSRKGREVLVAQVRHEVTRQLDGMGVTNLEDLARQVATLLGRSAAAGRTATGGAGSGSPGRTGGSTGSATDRPAPSAKKTATKKSATKKTTAKAATAKKSPAKKAPAKKAPAKRAPTNKPSTTRTASAGRAAATAEPARPSATGASAVPATDAGSRD